MAYPVTLPVLTQSQSIDAISEAEAGIAQCMANFLCNEIFPGISALANVEDQVELSKTILCAFTCKEKGMGELIDALAYKTLADKGLVPGGDKSSGCSCDC